MLKKKWIAHQLLHPSNFVGPKAPLLSDEKKNEPF